MNAVADIMRLVPTPAAPAPWVFGFVHRRDAPVGGRRPSGGGRLRRSGPPHPRALRLRRDHAWRRYEEQGAPRRPHPPQHRRRRWFAAGRPPLNAKTPAQGGGAGVFVSRAFRSGWEGKPAGAFWLFVFSARALAENRYPLFGGALGFYDWIAASATSPFLMRHSAVSDGPSAFGMSLMVTVWAAPPFAFTNLAR